MKTWAGRFPTLSVSSRCQGEALPTPCAPWSPAVLCVGWQWEAGSRARAEKPGSRGEEGKSSSSGALRDPASKAPREPEGTGPRPKQNLDRNEHFTLTLKRRMIDSYQVLSMR